MDGVPESSLSWWVQGFLHGLYTHVFVLRRHHGCAVNHQVAIVGEPHLQPGQWTWSRTGNDAAIPLECASMTRASNDPCLRLPNRQASQMSANRAECIKALLQANYKNAEARIQSHRINRIVLRLAHVHDGRGLVEDAGSQVLQTEYATTQPRYRQ